MSLGDIIANYIAQQRCLGKRFSAEATIWLPSEAQSAMCRRATFALT